MTLATFAVVRRSSPPSFSPSACAPLDVLRAAFEGSPHGVVVSGEDGTILFVNALASAIFDYPPGQLIGQPLSRLLPEAVPPPHDDRWTEFWKNPHSAAMIAGRTIAGIRHDGVRVPLEIGLSAFDDGSTRHVIASIVDITERLNLEARLAAATNAHLGFQRLVADVAAPVRRRRSGCVDDAIVDGLRQIGEALQLDCAVLWRWGSDGTNASPLLHWVQPSSLPPEPFPIASIPFVVASLKAGESCCFATVDDLPDPDRDAFRRHGFRSGAVVPLTPTGDGERGLSALALGSMTREQEWPPAIIERLRLVAGVMSQAFARRASHHALQKALDEIRRLRDRLSLGERRTSPRGEGAEDVASDGLGKPRHPAGARASRTGRAHARHRPAARRNRNGQGGDGAGDSRPQPAPSAADGPRELRGHSDRPHRERAVRPRAGRVHGRAVAADRTLRSRQPVHALPRRDR